jgi:hypothetical protein
LLLLQPRRWRRAVWLILPLADAAYDPRQMHPFSVIALLAIASLATAAVRAQGLAEFSTEGMPGSRGVVVRVNHPNHWKRVPLQDEQALAELRGRQGQLTGILQIGRGRRQADIASLCQPERARTMLQQPIADEQQARITDVVARRHGERPGFEIRYERAAAPDFLLVRSFIVCLKDTRLVVSCGATGSTKAALSAIEPVCTQVLDSLAISED